MPVGKRRSQGGKYELNEVEEWKREKGKEGKDEKTRGIRYKRMPSFRLLLSFFSGVSSVGT